MKTILVMCAVAAAVVSTPMIARAQAFAGNPNNYRGMNIGYKAPLSSMNVVSRGVVVGKVNYGGPGGHNVVQAQNAYFKATAKAKAFNAAAAATGYPSFTARARVVNVPTTPDRTFSPQAFARVRQ